MQLAEGILDALGSCAGDEWVVFVTRAVKFLADVSYECSALVFCYRNCFAGGAEEDESFDAIASEMEGVFGLSL